MTLQVACFTSTAMAAERCLAAKLPMAASQQEAEHLLQETGEAQQARLALKGIHDLRGLLESANRKRVLHPVHLDAVASTLEVTAPALSSGKLPACLLCIIAVCYNYEEVLRRHTGSSRL